VKTTQKFNFLARKRISNFLSEQLNEVRLESTWQWLNIRLFLHTVRIYNIILWLSICFLKYNTYLKFKQSNKNNYKQS